MKYWHTWWTRHRFTVLMASMITLFAATVALIVHNTERGSDEFRSWCVNDEHGQIVETTPLVCVVGNVEVRIQR